MSCNEASTGLIFEPLACVQASTVIQWSVPTVTPPSPAPPCPSHPTAAWQSACWAVGRRR